MKKINYIVSIIVFTILIIPIDVSAHPGRLDSSGCHYCRTNCANWGLETNEYHCHSGNTYLNTKGEIYDKSGTKISGGNTSNNYVTEKNENNNTTTEDSTNKPTSTKPVQKNEDTSLKYIKVDNQNIAISDEVIYETSKSNIELDIQTADNKTLVEFDNPKLTIGKNEIIIKVTAEAGNIKEYKLIITRKEIKSSVVIKKLILGASEVHFENNKAVIEKLSNESSFEYSYELSDETANLVLYVNDKETTEINNIKNKDIIKLVVIDADENQNIYEIEVTEISEIESAIINIIAYTIVAGMFILPTIIIGIIIYRKKRKK